VIAVGKLVAALRRSKVADWTVIAREQEIATADDHLARREECHRIALIVHHDLPRGRGSARLELVATDVNPDELVAQAIKLATAAVGPPWQSVPVAAPASVTVFDPELAGQAVETIAASLVERALRPKDATVELVGSAMVERVEATTRAGLVTKWTASQLRLRGVIATATRSLAVGAEGRVRRDVAGRFDEELAAARADLADLERAAAPNPGLVTLVLRSAAMLAGETPGGVWSVFAPQADAVLERQGLTRYRPGTLVAAGADRISPPLSIVSDGARDFGLLSAPLGEDGDAVRKFTLVDRGLGATLALSMREAALRRGEPNGGVKNLDVALGEWDGLPGTGRTIEVKRLRHVAIDPYTGDASFDLELATEGEAPITGGTVRLDLIAALAGARRSRSRIELAGYRGPDAIAIDGVELIA
jgi:hypothetical protein